MKQHTLLTHQLYSLVQLACQDLGMSGLAASSRVILDDMCSHRTDIHAPLHVDGFAKASGGKLNLSLRLPPILTGPCPVSSVALLTRQALLPVPLTSCLATVVDDYGCAGERQVERKQQRLDQAPSRAPRRSVGREVEACTRNMSRCALVAGHASVSLFDTWKLQRYACRTRAWC